MKTANFRIGRLEFRTCSASLGQNQPHDSGEIVLWHDRDASCYTIAYWRQSENGHYLNFVGTRPFDEFVIPAEFMRLARLGQEHLSS